ncbi:MAG TPA: hypothetical protein VEW07_06380 [Solirubrobacterales bacterium]|nr:hypothetical protein [Solirubrobacterales bacterium]
MAPVRYVPNPLFEEEVREQPQHEKGMRTITKGVAKAVRTAARPFRNTGYYERRVRVKAQSVVASDFAWHWVEFGSVHNPPYAPFRRGLRAAGIRLVMDPKPPR